MSRILLIEPDRVLAEPLYDALTKAGHRVVPCASGQAAIMAADEATPVAVILELQLIGHSGFEFLYELRSYSEWQAIPVLIHSQIPPAEFYASSQLLNEQLGISDYLYKSQTSLSQLCRAVEACLQPVAA